MKCIGKSIKYWCCCKGGYCVVSRVASVEGKGYASDSVKNTALLLSFNGSSTVLNFALFCFAGEKLFGKGNVEL